MFSNKQFLVCIIFFNLIFSLFCMICYSSFVIVCLFVQFVMKPIEIRLVGRFKFTSKLEEPHQHLIYKGVHAQTNEPLFLKGEEYKARPNEHFLTLLQEGKILQIMQGGIGIPHMHWCGQEEDYNFIVLQQLGSSLLQLLARCQGRFSKKTAFSLGCEVVSILQYFHFKSFLHGQVSPKNILLGAGQKQNRVFIVDYGGASRFKDPNTLEHVKEQQKGETRSLNMEFSSLRYHRGEACSRKDDLQSLLYVLLYTVKGSLPWSAAVHCPKKTETERSKAVLKIKLETDQQILFQGQNELLMLFRYTQALKFDEKPRYVYYKNVFKQSIQKIGIDDKVFDWMLLEEPLFPEQPTLNFEIVPNEAEFIKQICLQLKNIEKKQAETENKKRLNSQGNDLKSPRSFEAGKNAKQKDCEIY